MSKLGTLPVLPPNPTLEQLKTALKTKKPDCSALLAHYQCGQNEILSIPSGELIQVGTGDEIAINSIAFEVVALDGSGNGRGIVKVPMFNNAKFGVKFENIKVAKGGCVVAGEAVLSNVDLAILNEEQRKKLAETYEAMSKVLAIADSLAPQIAKGINSLSDKLFEKKRNTQKLLSQTNIENLTEVLSNCADITTLGRTLQDSLEKAICLAKKGNLKAKLSSLEEASKANIDFINKLGPALASCQNQPKWEDWTQKNCSGPCVLVWEMNPWFELDCKNGLKKVFGVDENLIVYDFEKESPIDDLFNFLQSDDFFNQDKGKYKKNGCGEFLMFEKVLPNLGGNGSVTVLSPPKGKKSISSFFTNDIEYYQYLVLRLSKSNAIGCRNFKLGEKHLC